MRPARCDGPHAVAGVAEGEVDGGAGQRADLGDVAGGHVDRAAPGVRDAATRERGERSARGGRAPRPPRLRRARRGRTRATAVGEPAAAPAEDDAPVARGAEVVDQRAAVGDALAAGPAELLDHVGHRLGQDDVRGGDGQPRAQLARSRARRGADRQHRRAGAHVAAGRSRRSPRRRSRCAGDASAGRARASARRRARRARSGAVAGRARAAPGGASRSRGSARRGETRGEAQRSRTCSAGQDAARAPGRRARRRPRPPRGRPRRTRAPSRRTRSRTGRTRRRPPRRGTSRRSPTPPRSTRRAAPRAGASPKRSRSAGADSHIDSQKPPLRPLGPWPHTPASSSATRAPASSRSQAVHMPV